MKSCWLRAQHASRIAPSALAVAVALSIAGAPALAQEAPADSGGAVRQSASTSAREPGEQSGVPSLRDRPRVLGNWGITIWGVSYHVDKSLDYNGQNWGAGVRHYSRPDWRWLGSSAETRTFVEVDALKNSWDGLVLPVSAGVEYKVASLSDSCSLFAVAALTGAYYYNAVKDASSVRVGPVPGLVMGCGHVRSNAVFVLSPKSILGVIAGSWTIVF